MIRVGRKRAGGYLRGTIAVAAVIALLFSALDVSFSGVQAQAHAQAQAPGAQPQVQPPQSVLVVEDHGDVLEPAHPLPFTGRRVELVPTPYGGYQSRVASGVLPATRGYRLDFTESGPRSVHVTLARPVPLYGQQFSDLYVHPHGAVSFGMPLPEEAAASASASAELIPGLLSGPPVVAALWNELDPKAVAADAQKGVFVAELPDRVVVSWLDVPSERPYGEPNTFRITIHRSGRIDLEYLRMASSWGVVGISPGARRTGTEMVDLADGPPIESRQAALAVYRDRPRLNEVALARRVYEAVPDRYEFMTVFTDQVVDAPHLVSSLTVANRESGIGMPLFDHSSVFGTKRLEHMVMMNALDFYDDDPTAPPRIPGYARTPSTLAVLAHETGHRWLANLGAPYCPEGREGHWSFFLDSSGSFMGGGDLQTNPDGSFTSLDAMTRFGPLDQYLMGLAPPEAVPPFFVVDDPHNLTLADGTPTTHQGAYPERGVSFHGTRRQLDIDDVIDAFGPREPEATRVPRVFRMAFVLVTSTHTAREPDEVAKVEKIRRAFGPFMRNATDGRAWLRTWLLKRPTALASDRQVISGGAPAVIGAEMRHEDDGALVASIDFFDLDGDLVRLDVSSDASQELPPARVDVVPGAYGSRRGTVSFTLRNLPPGASAVQVELVDASGHRSPTLSLALPS